MFGLFITLRTSVSVGTNLLEARDGIHELNVKLGVVLGQRLVSVVADELHH